MLQIKDIFVQRVGSEIYTFYCCLSSWIRSEISLYLRQPKLENYKTVKFRYDMLIGDNNFAQTV